FRRGGSCRSRVAADPDAGKICNPGCYRTVLLSQLVTDVKPAGGCVSHCTIVLARAANAPDNESTARCWRAAREKAALNSGSPWAAAPNGAEERGWCAAPAVTGAVRATRM